MKGDKDYSTTIQNNPYRSNIQKPKKRKWPKILGIIFLVIVLFLFISFIYLKLSYNSDIRAMKEDTYSYVKCLDFCPTKEIGSINDPKYINEVCMAYCTSENQDYKVLEKRLSGLDNKILGKVYGTHYIEEDIVKYQEDYFRCLQDLILNNSKSCAKNFLEENKEYATEFKEPVYQDITLNLISATCSKQETIVNFELTEGKIKGINFILYEEGDSISVKKIEDFNQGINSVKIRSAEYSELTNPTEVSLSYIFEVDGQEWVSVPSPLIPCN